MCVLDEFIVLDEKRKKDFELIQAFFGLTVLLVGVFLLLALVDFLTDFEEVDWVADLVLLVDFLADFEARLEDLEDFEVDLD
ncbi:hypothetical protein L5515_003668 [Caenorhabditis briggsae]|uniref:Uncharacterized protein n=1 Tax=Caenorhabditis briggsae TaxID=6238 RepID=A0AAE9EIH5_CAEBR|nr:hypothetical protein L5515_003668 [Caenorhabditis briggsae]